MCVNLIKLFSSVSYFISFEVTFYFQFINFLERLARALNMDEISNDIGVDLHTESLLLRAEQLARLENEKLVDKVRYNYVNLILK